MSSELYSEIYKNGLNLNSPSVDKAVETVAAVKDTQSKLQSIPTETSGLDAALLEETEAALDSALAVVTDSHDQMQTNLDATFATINAASGVNRLEEVDGCEYLTNATGSLMGDADGWFDAIMALALEQAKAITGFLAGEIALDEITERLSAANAGYKAVTDSLSGYMAKESALLGDMASKLKASSLAKSLSGLWENPCAKGVLEQLVPDNLKGLLNGK